jgi:tol-pal system protein YbgF
MSLYSSLRSDAIIKAMKGAKTSIILSLTLVLSCGGVTKEELEKRLGGIESRLTQLEERQKVLEERSVRTESRIDGLSEGLTNVRLEVEKLKLSRDRTPTLQQAMRIPEPRKEEEVRTEAAKNPQEVEEYRKDYDEALKLVNLKQLNQAKDRLIDYIKRYPKTDLTDNAYLWLGVVYRDLGETNKAEAVWLTLVERCQKKEMVDCNKAPSALLQLARLSEQKGDNQRAKEYYEAILRDYPLSEEAQTAKTRLGR